jgi:hypothetical protein
LCANFFVFCGKHAIKKEKNKFENIRGKSHYQIVESHLRGDWLLIARWNCVVGRASSGVEEER